MMDELFFTMLYIAAPAIAVLVLAELYWRVSWWWSMRRYRQLQWRRMQEAVDVKND